MNALEDEPDKKGRGSRMLIGIGITAALGAGVLFGADSISPLRKKMPDVLKMVVIDEPHELPVKKDEPPPPPPPPPPKNLPKPKPTDKQTQQPQPVAQPIKQNDNQPDPVGMDADSFGSGTGGAAFAQGTTLMGTPGEAARGFAAPEEKPKPKLVEARPKAGNPQPSYTERARRLGVQGLMVIETEIDELGRVTRAIVRGKLEPVLDAEAVKTVLAWRFDPATLEGKALPSTKWLRIRFDLE